MESASSADSRLRPPRRPQVLRPTQLSNMHIKPPSIVVSNYTFNRIGASFTKSRFPLGLTSRRGSVTSGIDFLRRPIISTVVHLVFLLKTLDEQENSTILDSSGSNCDRWTIVSSDPTSHSASPRRRQDIRSLPSQAKSIGSDGVPYSVARILVPWRLDYPPESFL